jgi:hypothetical protein
MRDGRGATLNLRATTYGPAMTVSPNLQIKLQQTLGAEAAGDLLAWMQTMDAHRGDIGELRHEMGELRHEMGELRHEMGEVRRGMGELRHEMQLGLARVDGRMEAMQAGMERMMEKGLREQTRFFFLAWSVLLAAIIGLYARQ